MLSEEVSKKRPLVKRTPLAFLKGEASGMFLRKDKEKDLNGSCGNEVAYCNYNYYIYIIFYRLSLDHRPYGPLELDKENNILMESIAPMLLSTLELRFYRVASEYL